MIFIKKIIFYPRSQHIKGIIDSPKPIEAPDWFKKISPYQKMGFSTSKKLFVSNGETNLSVKSCMPFLDSLTSGYSFQLWCDIQVRVNEITGEKMVFWANTDEELSPLQSRPDPETPVS